MGKKFIFNSETLSYEISKFSLKKVIISVLPHLFITIILGGILGYTLFNTVKTPEYKSLQQNNENLISNFRYLSHQVDNQSKRMSQLETTDDNVYRSVLGLKPISQANRTLGYGGSSHTTNYDLQRHNDIVESTYRESILLQNRIKLEAESYDDILQLIRNKEDLINSVPSICPIANNDLRRIGSGFGYRMHPILHVLKMHTGVDISAERGTPIYAAGDGVVTRADASSSGYGNCVRINHGYNYITLYAHMYKMNVSPGEIVKRGQIIGLVGSTGRSTSPHLHYEVRINNEPVNPENFFYLDMSQEEYEEITKQATRQSVEPM